MWREDIWLPAWHDDCGGAEPDYEGKCCELLLCRCYDYGIYFYRSFRIFFIDFGENFAFRGNFSISRFLWRIDYIIVYIIYPWWWWWWCWCWLDGSTALHSHHDARESVWERGSCAVSARSQQRWSCLASRESGGNTALGH